MKPGIELLFDHLWFKNDCIFNCKILMRWYLEYFFFIFWIQIEVLDWVLSKWSFCFLRAFMGLLLRLLEF